MPNKLEDPKPGAPAQGKEGVLATHRADFTKPTPPHYHAGIRIQKHLGLDGKLRARTKRQGIRRDATATLASSPRSRDASGGCSGRQPNGNPKEIGQSNGIRRGWEGGGGAHRVKAMAVEELGVFAFWDAILVRTVQAVACGAAPS